MTYHNRTIDETLKDLDTYADTGLDTSDAELLLSIIGENKLREKKKKFATFL